MYDKHIRMSDIQYIEKIGNRFKISWKMTDWCNYRCSYCYMANAVAKNNHTPETLILDIADHIDDIINIQAKGRKVTLHLIGGEIGYYNLKEVISRIKSPLLSNIIFATNFSQPLEFWEKLVFYCRSRNIKPQIIASFHLEQCDHKEYMHKAIKLGVRTKAVVNSNNINIYRPYFERLDKAGNRIEITVERDSRNICEQLYGDTLQYFNQLNEKLNAHKKPYLNVHLKDGTIIPYGTNIELINNIDVGGLDTQDFYCTAGIDGIRIKQDGSLQRGGCLWTSLLHDCGHILGEYHLPTEPTKCHTNIIENGKHRYKLCTCFSGSSMTRA